MVTNWVYTSPSFVAGEATVEQIAGYLIAGLMWHRGRRVQIVICAADAVEERGQRESRPADPARAVS